MGFGVIEGENSVKRLSIGTEALGIASSEALSGVTVVGNQFKVSNLGQHLAMIHMLPGGPTNQNGYTAQLYNVTQGTVADSETRTLANGGMQVFLFTFNVTSVNDLYEIRMVISGGVGNTYKIDLVPLVFKMVIMPMAGDGSGTVTGSGTAGKIAKFTGVQAIGDSTIAETASVVSITGRDFSIDDGQKMLLGTDTSWKRDGAAVIGLGDASNTYLQIGANTSMFATANSEGVDITIRTANGNGADNRGGDLYLVCGGPAGAGRQGRIYVDGQIWDTSGAVDIPGGGTSSSCVGPNAVSISSGDYSASFGGANVIGDYATGIGYSAVASADSTVALGANSIANIEGTCNISGLDCARASDGNSDYWLNYGSRTNIVYGPETSLLATSTVTIAVPTGCHCWVEEVGLIQTELTLDGGSLTAQPTLSFGVTGDNDKHLAAQLMTLLSAEYNRERFTTLLTDVGETSFTMEISVAGTIAGGSGAEAYKARPFWVIRVVEDQPALA